MTTPSELKPEPSVVANQARTDIQTAEKASLVPGVTEHTRPGPIYSPPVDIFETDSSITVLADLPGVKAAISRSICATAC